jgi:Ca2+-binding RTX toxin-like protein
MSIIYGTNGNDYLGENVTDSVDTIYGLDGNDVFLGVFSNDKLYGGNGDDQFLMNWFGMSKVSYIDGGAGNNILYSLYEDISDITIVNIQNIYVSANTFKLNSSQFARFSTLRYSLYPEIPAGTLWAANAGTYDLSSKTVIGVFNLTGSAGADVLKGNTDGQVLDGGAGADQLTGGGGADIFKFSARTDSIFTNGKMDRIADFVIGTDKIDVTDLGFSGITTDTPSLGQLKVSYDAYYKQTYVRDMSGSGFGFYLTGNFLNLSASDFIGFGSAYNYVGGTEANNYLAGTAGQDLISGLGGDDQLQGLGGADKMLGGAGNDEFLVGWDEAAAGEIIDGGTGNNVLSTWNADLSGATISNVQTLGVHLDYVKLTESQFANFSAIIVYDGHATLQLAAAGTYDLNNKAYVGQFSFVGSAGDDVFVLNDTTASNIEMLNGGGGSNTLSVTNMSLDLSAIKLSNVQSLSLYYDVTLLADQMNGLNSIMAINGRGIINARSAGTYDLSKKLIQGTLNLMGSVGNDVLIGDSSSQTLAGGGGNDTIYGGGGNDLLTYGSGSGVCLLYGESGDDTLSDGDDNGTLDGGTGNDVLWGGLGNDTYIFGRGYYHDTIHELDFAVGSADVLSFGADIARDQLWFSHAGYDLLIQLIGTNDSVKIQNWYLGSDSHVEQIKTSDGHVLADTKVQNLVNAMAGMAVPSTTTLTAQQHAQLDSVIAASWT